MRMSRAGVPIAVGVASALVVSACVGVTCYVVGHVRGRQEGYCDGVGEATSHYAKLFAQGVRTWLVEDFLGDDKNDSA